MDLGVVLCVSLTAFLQRFVRVVTAVIIDITLPTLRDATSVAALELSRAAGPGGAVGRVFIRLITTVVLTVTLP